MPSELGILALRIGGSLHLVQLPATALLALNLRRQPMIATLPPLLSRVLLVLAGGIILAVLGGAVLAWLLPARALTEPFGAGFAVAWCVFWTYRLAIQCLVYGPRIPAAQRFAHHALTLVFVTKSACFGVAAAVALAGLMGSS